MEIQNSENNSIANECCQPTNKIHGSNPCCNKDPIFEAKLLLKRSLFTALTDVHVEKLKKQIEREWGSTIDKTVDLTIKTVAKEWQASLLISAANTEFYNELEKIMKTAKE